jgi:REP element-mobilizing transposase RayT
MSRILIKFPTRSRHEKAIDVINKYISFATDPDHIQIIVTIDQDDQPEKYIFTDPRIVVKIGVSNSKIHAINRDMPHHSTFDILLLASDDMIPIVRGYDDIIRTRMCENFPDGDGVLWFNDGFRQNRINTLVICGSKYYQRFGYIYYPEYKSLWCDNDFTDVANKLKRQVYFDIVIIKHEHPANNLDVKSDKLYESGCIILSSSK